MKRLILAFAVCLVVVASSNATTYSVHKGFGKQWDTLTIKVKFGQFQTRDSVIYTAKSIVDTNFIFGDDTIFTLLFLYKNNDGFWQSYTEQWLKTTKVGPFYWSVPSYLAVPSTDSLVRTEYKNGIMAFTENVGPVTNYYDLFREANRDTLYRVDYDWYVAGRSYPLTQTSTIYWDSIGGGLPVAGGSHVCAVTIEILNSDRSPAVGVWISAYLTSSNAHDSAGTGYTNTPVYKQTASNGRATFNCVWSNYLIPATSWRFTAHTSAIGGMRKTVMVPSTSSYLLNMNQ